MIIQFNTPEDFHAADLECGKARVAYMISQGYDGKTNINPRTGKPYPIYECETVFGTPESEPYLMDISGEHEEYLTPEFWKGRTFKEV